MNGIRRKSLHNKNNITWKKREKKKEYDKAYRARKREQAKSNNS